MKRNWKNNLIQVTLVFIMTLVASCVSKEEHAAHSDTYTCPMHPTVISDKPGACPVCGMDLVRKARPGEEIKITEDLAKLIKSPNEAVIASIKTIKGEFKAIPVSVEAQGVVTYDSRKIYTIPTRIGGRLEKVFLKYDFQPVRKGERIAEIYSPELVTAQRELIFLLENDPGNQELIQSAKERLRLLGASDSQINSLIQDKEPKITFAIYSPYDGYLIPEKQQAPVAPMTSQAAPSSSGRMSDGMGGSSLSSTQTKGSAFTNTAATFLREGSYVSTGQTLFTVVNPSTLRIELNIASALMGSVNLGQKVMLDIGNQQSEIGTIDFVQPFFSQGQEFLTVRVYIQNTDHLLIGQLVKGTIESKSIEALWIPKDAILDLGAEDIVFIKEKNMFKPKRVVSGVRTENQIEIIQGLSSSDEIAINAQYLVDSESFIKTN